MGDGGIGRLICALVGHKWVHVPQAVRGDREAFRCERCRIWGLNPSLPGEPHVPDPYREQIDEDGGDGDD